jgi:hypothetical protein
MGEFDKYFNDLNRFMMSGKRVSSYRITPRKKPVKRFKVEIEQGGHIYNLRFPKESIDEYRKAGGKKNGIKLLKVEGY